MRYPCLTHGVHIDIHFTFPTKDVLWDCGGKRLTASYTTLFPQGTLVSPPNKTDRHNITEILLKVALNTTTQTLNHMITHLVKKLILVIIALFEKYPLEKQKLKSFVFKCNVG
jgi:hypothetical protein